LAVYKIYCDESRQTDSQYKLMGGIWIKKECGWPFVDEFHNICINNLGFLPGHMKWTKVPSPSPQGTSKYLKAYGYLVNLYFKYNAEGKMFFKTIIADKDYDFSHDIFNRGDPEVGFYKLYYLLILNSLDFGNKYHIRVAKRNVSQKRMALDERSRLSDLQKCLNSGFIKKINYANNDDIVLTIEPRSARDRRLIQLADILTGAVGYHWNGFHNLPNAKPGKVLLANYIAKQVGRCNLCFQTYPSNRLFNIFRLKPKITAP